MFGLNKIGLAAIFALSITAVPVLAQDNDVFDEALGMTTTSVKPVCS